MSIVSSVYIMNPKTDSNSTLHVKNIKAMIQIILIVE